MKLSKNLEEKTFDLVSRGKFDGIKEPLIVLSGVNNKKEVDKYLRLHDELRDGVFSYANSRNEEYFLSENIGKAKTVFDYLQDSKLCRYQYDSTLFTEVIMNQLSPSITEAVGDCRSTTYLQSSLSQELGVKDLKVRKEKNHLGNILYYEGGKIEIDNTVSNGFNVSTNEICKVKELDFLIPSLLNFRAEKELYKNPDKAIDLSGKAIILDEEYGEAYVQRAIARINTGKIIENRWARKDIQKAFDLGYKYEEMYYYLAKSQSKMGKNLDAFRNINKALRLNSVEPNYYFERGKIFYEGRKFNSALKDFNHSRDLGLENCATHHYRGLTNLKLGRFREAVHDFDSIEESRNLKHLFLSFAKLKTKDFVGALTEFKTSMKKPFKREVKQKIDSRVERMIDEEIDYTGFEED